MKAIILAMLLLPTAAFAANSFNFYVSPKPEYSCSGYSTATCVGFETSNPTHVVDMGIIKATSQSPLSLLVQLFVDDEHYTGNVLASNAGFPFAVSNDAGTTIMVTIGYASTTHCVKAHCAARYLMENGTVSFP